MLAELRVLLSCSEAYLQRVRSMFGWSSTLIKTDCFRNLIVFYVFLIYDYVITPFSNCHL